MLAWSAGSEKFHWAFWSASDPICSRTARVATSDRWMRPWLPWISFTASSKSRKSSCRCVRASWFSCSRMQIDTRSLWRWINASSKPSLSRVSRKSTTLGPSCISLFGLQRRSGLWRVSQSETLFLFSDRMVLHEWPFIEFSLERGEFWWSRPQGELAS